MSTDLDSRLERLTPAQIERLDDTCDRFDAEWKTGKHPSIKDYLRDVADTERITWLRELLALELDLRRRRGERPTPREYLDQFPEDGATIEAAFADDMTLPVPDPALTEDIAPGLHQTDPGRTAEGASKGAVASPGDPIARLLRAGALAPPLRPGTFARLGHYDILGVLGSGGMGIVLRACEPNTGEQVAIKLLKPDLVNDPVAFFRREAHHMARLAHPNILRVSEVAGDAEWPFYVMPHMAGGPLSEALHGRPLDKSMTLHIARQVAAALAYAHTRGLIHRDLKPSNVLLDEAGQAYLADFGLARPFDNDTLLDLEQSQCVGTVPYMSPAVARGEAEDTRCDIYSFGAVLREMLTGRPPYQGHSVLDVLRQVMATPPEPISSVNPDAHPGLMQIAEGAMARDLRDRYATMTDIIADLDRVAHGQEPLGPHGQAPRLPAPWRRWVVPALGLSLTVVLILLSLVAMAFRGLFYRQLAAGDLDPKFGHRGKVFTDLATFSVDNCRKVLVQPDGKILAVGRSVRSGRMDFAVVRYTAGGQRDSNFGEGGVALTPLGEEAEATGIALHPDGKIVIVGHCGPKRGPQDIVMVRYNANGTPDDQFGTSGVVITDLGGDDYAVGIAIQPDGRIVAVGHTGQPRIEGQEKPPHDFAVLRYHDDGSPDRRFGKEGVVLTDLRGADEAAAVALQPDGKILVGGHSGPPSSASQKDPSYDFAVVRYNADGTVDDGSPTDTTPGDRFGLDGRVFTDFGGRDEIWSIMVQSDGKIVAGGFSWGDVTIETLGIRLARYTADGSLDPSFGTGGRVSTDLDGEDQAFDFVLQPDGSIVAAVNRYHVHNMLERRVPLSAEKTLVIRPPQHPSPSYDIAVVRYNSDGTLDTQFGRDGVVFTEPEPEYEEIAGPGSVALQPDGKIMFGATAIGSRGQDFVLLRYLGRSQRAPRWW